MPSPDDVTALLGEWSRGNGSALNQLLPLVYAELRRARPDYSFLMEESGVVEGSDSQHRWLVDPLDGTTNFLHGIPIFAVSIALERQGQIVAGVIFNPAMDELYTAERGGGAFLNDRRLRVSGRSKLVDSVIGTGVPHLGRGDHGNYLLQMRNVMAEVSGIRRMGAAALDLAYVAAGRLDGFWEEGLSPWDIGAGIIMIREAGGFVTNLDGEQDVIESKAIIAGNEAIQRALLKTLKKPV